MNAPHTKKWLALTNDQRQKYLSWHSSNPATRAKLRLTLATDELEAIHEIGKTYAGFTKEQASAERARRRAVKEERRKYNLLKGVSRRQENPEPPPPSTAVALACLADAMVEFASKNSISAYQITTALSKARKRARALAQLEAFRAKGMRPSAPEARQRAHMTQAKQHLASRAASRRNKARLEQHKKRHELEENLAKTQGI